MKIKILITILLCIGLMLCFIACSDEDTGESGNNPTESSASSQNGGGESKPSEDDKTGYHTVTFVTNNGTTIEPVMVERGNPIPVQAKPEKAGYVFDGWYVDDEKWSFISHVVLIDLTLEAKWIANDNTLVFDGNGATGGTMENMTIKSDESANLTLNAFTKDGYTFMGWSTTQGGKVEYTDGAEYTMGTEASYTLYAIWEANDNNITFDGNRATSGSTAGINAKTDERVTLTLNGFIRDGYTFKGWATTQGGKVEYTDGAEYVIGTEASYTLYAVWEANVYTITYEKNGGTGELKETFTIKDLPLTLSYLDDKTNYVFNCWYKESDFSGEPVFEIAEIGNLTLYAEYIECTDGLKLSATSTTYTVNGYTGTATEVVIPRSYKGKEVTSIGYEAFLGCTRLTRVTIPDSVTRIGGSAFSGCTGLTSITIPDSVTSIGGSAFSGCTSLTSITIPDSVKSIGGSAFSGCTSLESITIPEGVTSIVNYMFYNCTSLKSITVPEGVTSIGNYVFYNCTSLKSITIPEGVTSIGNYAFYWCTSLTSITIPEGVTSIGGYAFRDCTSLTSIIIPDSVTSIGVWAFCNCTKLTIYCEAENQPDGWSSDWNVSNCPVVWGVK